MAYIGARPDNVVSQNTYTEYNYTADSAQTVFTTDSDGKILAYSLGNIEAYLNGVRLEETDYTATTGNSFTLTAGATLGDELSLVAYRVFSSSDTVSASTGGTFSGGITGTTATFSGTITGGGYSGDGSGLSNLPGMFKGERGTVGTNAGDIFRVNEQTLNTNVTIGSTENASATGPLTVATGVTLTVDSGGSLAIV